LGTPVHHSSATETEIDENKDVFYPEN